MIHVEQMINNNQLNELKDAELKMNFFHRIIKKHRSKLLQPLYFIISKFSPLLLLLFSSCTSESDNRHTAYDDISKAPAIIADHSLTIASGGDFIIGGIADVKVLDDGRIVILDNQTLSFHLISKEGGVISSHSLDGRGPGEVQNMSSRLRISDNNTVAIDDYLMKKISMFQVQGESFEHITDVALEASISDYFLSDGQVVLNKSTNQEAEEPTDPIRIIDLESGDERRTVREFPAQKEITLTGEMSGLNFTINTSTQYHIRNNFCSYGNSLYHIRTDSLGFWVYDLKDGNMISSAIYHLPAVRLTEEEMEIEIDKILESGREFWGESEKARLKSEMPEYKPLVKRVICDLPDGIWLEQMSQDEESWIFLSGDGEIQGIFQKEMEGQLKSIHRGQIFISESDDVGNITLMAYSYSLPDGL